MAGRQNRADWNAAVGAHKVRSSVYSIRIWECCLKLRYRNGATATVFWDAVTPRDNTTLLVRLRAGAEAECVLPWEEVVGDLEGDICLPLAGPAGPIILSPHERYLIDGAGWEILMSVGIVPTVWRDG
jgi:hypothetical protein